MKLIKTRLRNRLGELSLSLLIESPETLFDSDLEEVVTIWNKKVEELQFKLLTCSQSLYTRMYIRIYVLFYYYYICTCIIVLLYY